MSSERLLNDGKIQVCCVIKRTRSLKVDSNRNAQIITTNLTLICDIYNPVLEPGFAIICLPAGMHVHISRQSLPSLVDPSLLRLDDPRCGVIQMDNNNVMLATPLDSCGTTRRYPTGSPVLFLIRLLVTS